jgi:hypothetical protein
MKKLFAIAILGSLVFVSCEKTSSGGLLQATINGTVTNLGTAATATTSGLTGLYTITIQGATGTALSSGDFGISISSISPIVAGIYTDTVSVFGANLAELQYIPSATVAGPVFGSASQKSHPTTVVVTSVSSTQITGTFQGTIYAADDTAAASTTITNGTFNMKLTAAIP